MGKVHYKFEFNENIDPPKTIQFDTFDADIDEDRDGLVVEGDVGEVADEDGSPVTKKSGDEELLKIFVESSGKVGSTWKLTVTYTDKDAEGKDSARKVKPQPIEGTIAGNGILIINKDFKVEK